MGNEIVWMDTDNTFSEALEQQLINTLSPEQCEAWAWELQEAVWDTREHYDYAQIGRAVRKMNKTLKRLAERETSVNR